MGVDREEVDRYPAHVEVERADRLDGVAVERHALLAADGADLRDRLDRADLVVRVHDRDERGAVVDRIADRLRVDDPVAIHSDHIDAHVRVQLEVTRGVDHRVMLDRGRDEPVTSVLDLQHAP